MLDLSRRIIANLRRGGMIAQVDQFHGSAGERRRSRTHALVAVATAIVCLGLVFCVWKTGAVPQMLFGHDLIFFLDGAWKWKWGMLPHVDYYSPASALTFLLPAIGAALSGNMIDAFPVAISVFALFVLPLALYATFSRMRPVAAALASLIIVAACLAPHELRFESSAWSYSAFYNRWGYALFCIGLLVVTVSPRKQSCWFEVLDGGIAGLVVSLLIFLKISYGLLALAVLFAFIPIVRRNLFYYATAFLAVMAVGFVFGILLHWDFASFARDMGLAAHARKNLGVASLVGWALTLWPDLLALGLLIVLWSFGGVRYRSVNLYSRVLNGALLFCCYAVSASAILMSNSPLGGLRESPVLCVAAAIVWSAIIYECWTRRERTELIWQSWRIPIVAAAGVLTMIVVLPVVSRNLHSIAGAARWKWDARAWASEQIIHEGPLKGLQVRFFGGEPPLPTSYVGKIRDGLALLEATGNATKPVVSLDFTNPFNVARAVKPSRTAPTVWQLGFVYSMEAAPRPENVFGPGDVVMW
nr:hypothetical protein [Verrucomicrobiota bacterium]